MAGFSLIMALVTGLFVSLFSGFPGLLPVFLFAVLLVVNCECMAANVCEEDKTSMMFMAVISSGLVVLLCGIIVSSNLNKYLCDIGLQDPDKVHPLVPFLTFGLIVIMYRIFLNRAKRQRLLVQRYGTSLKDLVDRHTYNPKLKRIRRTMIEEGILTERLPDEEEY